VPSADEHLLSGKLTGTMNRYLKTCNLRVLNSSLKYVREKCADLLIFFFLYYDRRNAAKAGRYGKDVMRFFLLLLLTMIALGSCNAQRDIQAEFQKSLANYNESVRWRQLETASLFPADSISGEYKERVKKANNAEVVDYRIMDIRYDDTRKEAEVKVEIDYYTLSSSKVRTLVDIQRWVYQEKDGAGSWRLTSLFPEFP
jgi:hypothetical protein